MMSHGWYQRRLYVLVAMGMVVSFAVAGERLVLLEEHFEHGGAFPPPNWTVEHEGEGTTTWSLAGNPSDYSARILMQFDWDPWDERLVSPVVDCTNYGNLKLKWWTYYLMYPGSTQDTAFVDCSTDGGSSWETLTYYTTTEGHNPDSVDVPQAAGHTQVKFRWRWYAPDWDYRRSWEVDDILLEAGLGTDVGVEALVGPSSFDRLIQGADVRVWAKVKNHSTSDESNVTVTCVSSPSSFSSSVTIPSLGAGETTIVSFDDLWSVPASGTYGLTAFTVLPGDGDASNDTASVTDLIPISFSISNDIILSWEDTAEYDAYTTALSGISVGCDLWNRGAQGNLYGLDAWATVIFAEQPGFYPSAAEQIALMRFLDEGTTERAKKFLVISGDHIGNYYNLGVLIPEFYEEYLHATSDGDQISPAGVDTFLAAPCTFIGGTAVTESLVVDHNYADVIGADALAESLYIAAWSPVVLPVAIQYDAPDREHVYLGFCFSDITTQAQRQGLVERILAWFEGPPPPSGMGTVTIQVTGINVLLSWENDSSWVCPTFRIYRDTTAHFSPSGIYDETDSLSYVDVGAGGDPGVNYFYCVLPVDFGQEGAVSGIVGEFDFALP